MGPYGCGETEDLLKTKYLLTAAGLSMPTQSCLKDNVLISKFNVLRGWGRSFQRVSFQMKQIRCIWGNGYMIFQDLDLKILFWCIIFIFFSVSPGRCNVPTDQGSHSTLECLSGRQKNGRSSLTCTQNSFQKQFCYKRCADHTLKTLLSNFM